VTGNAIIVKKDQSIFGTGHAIKTGQIRWLVFAAPPFSGARRQA
jgi:hypothetical protein